MTTACVWTGKERLGVAIISHRKPNGMDGQSRATLAQPQQTLGFLMTGKLWRVDESVGTEWSKPSGGMALQVQWAERTQWARGADSRQSGVLRLALQWPRATRCLKGSFPPGVQQVSTSLARPGGLCLAAFLKRQTRWLTELLAHRTDSWGARGLTPLSPGRNAKSSLDNMLYCFILSMPGSPSLC